MPDIIQIKYQKSFTNTSQIDANGTWLIPIPNADVNKHNFFNDLTITNSSNSAILVYPDQDLDRAIRIPSKTSINFSFTRDNMRFSSILVKEVTGTAISAYGVHTMIMKKRFAEVGNNA